MLGVSGQDLFQLTARGLLSVIVKHDSRSILVTSARVGGFLHSNLTMKQRL